MAFERIQLTRSAVAPRLKGKVVRISIQPKVNSKNAAKNPSLTVRVSSELAADLGFTKGKAIVPISAMLGNGVDEGKIAFLRADKDDHTLNAKVMDNGGVHISTARIPLANNKHKPQDATYALDGKTLIVTLPEEWRAAS